MLKDNIVSLEVFERGKPFSNLYFCLFVGKQTLFVFLLGKRYFQVRVDRNIGAIVYAGLILHAFIFDSFRNLKFVRRVQGQIISATVWLAGIKGRTCSV